GYGSCRRRKSIASGRCRAPAGHRPGRCPARIRARAKGRVRLRTFHAVSSRLLPTELSLSLRRQFYSHPPAPRQRLARSPAMDSAPIGWLPPAASVGPAAADEDCVLLGEIDVPAAADQRLAIGRFELVQRRVFEVALRGVSKRFCQ